MRNTSVFLEEYKRLDHLCGDLFGCPFGVTAYLNQMKRDTFIGHRVPNWDADYRMLKRFRHLRTQLAHEEGTFETLDISQRDIADIRAFHKRILSQTDPLALLKKSGAAASVPTAAIPPAPPNRIPKPVLRQRTAPTPASRRTVSQKMHRKTDVFPVVVSVVFAFSLLVLIVLFLRMLLL